MFMFLKLDKRNKFGQIKKVFLQTQKLESPNFLDQV